MLFCDADIKGGFIVICQDIDVILVGYNVIITWLVRC